MAASQPNLAPSVFVNLFSLVYDYFHTTTAELSCCFMNHVACETEKKNSLAPKRKSWQTLV